MIIAILNDLFFAAKIRTTATQLGTELLLVRTKEDIIRALGENKVKKIILDLNFNKFDVFDFLREINTEDIYVIGYLSHVQVDLKRKAEHYCDLVLPRSDFSNRLPELLS